jgi:hypothetical protein
VLPQSHRFEPVTMPFADGSQACAMGTFNAPTNAMPKIISRIWLLVSPSLA